MKDSKINEVNPDFPCKVIVFNIKNALFGLNGFERRPPYEAARKYWKIEQEFRDPDIYEYAVGLADGIAETAYKIEKWFPTKEKEYLGRYEFCGKETTETNQLCGFSWKPQRTLCMKFWQFGGFLVVEFNGKGKFSIIRPGTERNRWYNCKGQ